jgi:hypothetical protein
MRVHVFNVCPCTLRPDPVTSSAPAPVPPPGRASSHSMVHFPPIAIDSYLKEIYRILRPGGTAFLHHSNLPACPLQTATKKATGVPFMRRLRRGLYRLNASCGIPGNPTANPAARNVMTAERFSRMARCHGLEIVKQHRMYWPPEAEVRARKPDRVIVDVISMVRRPMISDQRHQASEAEDASLDCAHALDFLQTPEWNASMPLALPSPPPRTHKNTAAASHRDAAVAAPARARAGGPGSKEKLLAKLEALEAENRRLNAKLAKVAGLLGGGA